MKKLENLESIRKIENKNFLNKKSEDFDLDNQEMLVALLDLLKSGVVKFKVIHNKEVNSWKAEFYFVDTGNVYYYTDLPNEVNDLMSFVIASGFEPEYIEE